MRDTEREGERQRQIESEEDRNREREREREGEKRTTQESTDREYRRFAGDPVPLPSPALSYSAKGAGRLVGHGLVACTCVAIYAQINYNIANDLRTAQKP